MRTGRHVGLVGLVAVLGAAPAYAQSDALAQGRAAFERADFAAATARFDEVLRAPTARRAELTDAHRFLLTLALATGDTPGADAHALAAVALDPAVTAPEIAPPAVDAALARARATRGGARIGLELTTRASVRAPGATEVRAVARSVPEVLGLRLALRCVRDGAEVASATARATDAPVEATVPAGAAIACEARLETEAGARVETARWRGAGTSRFTAENTAPRAHRVPPYGLYIGLGVGALVVAGVLTAVIAVVDANGPVTLGPVSFR